MKQFPLPLKIDCKYLNEELIFDLADRLRQHFYKVEIFGGDCMFAGDVLSERDYHRGWRILDKYNVLVT